MKPIPKDHRGLYLAPPLKHGKQLELILVEDDDENIQIFVLGEK